MTGRIALAVGGRVSWRLLVLAGLLSLLLCGALTQVLRAGQDRSPALAGASTPPLSGAGLWSLPPAARASVSAALGAQAKAYRFGAAPDGLRASNPAQHTRVQLDRAGAQIDVRGLRLGLRLSAVGYGASLRPLASAQPYASANRGTYAHPGISEWYVNGPLGLEQGFTLARAPAHPAAGPLTLAISISGDLRPALASGVTASASVTRTAWYCATAA